MCTTIVANQIVNLQITTARKPVMDKPTNHLLGKFCNKHAITMDAELTVTISFSDPPKNTSVLVEPSGQVLHGSSVSLTCTSIANPAAVNFTWFRVAGREKEMVGSERDYIFNATKLSEDQYYCEALNVHGAEYSEPANLDVTCEIYLSVDSLEAFIFLKKFDQAGTNGQLHYVSQLFQRSCLLPAVSRFYL